MHVYHLFQIWRVYMDLCAFYIQKAYFISARYKMYRTNIT